MKYLTSDEQEFIETYRNLNEFERNMVKVLGEGMRLASYSKHLEPQIILKDKDSNDVRK